MTGQIARARSGLPQGALSWGGLGFAGLSRTSLAPAGSPLAARHGRRTR